MNMKLKGKYTTDRPMMNAAPCKARTGNSHGPAKGRKKDGKWNQGPQKVMVVNGFTGHARMEFA